MADLHAAVKTIQEANAQRVSDAQIPHVLQSFVDSHRGSSDIGEMHLDQIERAGKLLKLKGFGVPWREVWSGVEDRLGWVILQGEREVAFIGDMAGAPLAAAVRAIVVAHNTALGFLE